jgi:hypothetical protein
VTFTLASIAGRALIFMVVGVLFRVFGAPIKRFIDKYLGLVTTGFVALVVGGVLAIAMAGDSGEETRDRCAGAATVATVAAR